MIHFGGCGTIACYSTFADTWSFNGHRWRRLPAPGDPPSRGLHALVPGPGGIVLAAGGIDGVTYVPEMWSYDGAWRATNGSLIAIRSAGAFDPSGARSLFFGGADPTTGVVLSRLTAYDGRNVSVLDDRSIPPRENHAVAFDEGRNVFVVVGGCTDVDCTGYIARHDEWDGNTWTEIAADPEITRRGAPALAYDPRRGRVLLFGGVDGPTYKKNTLWEWDGSTWAPIPTRGLEPMERTDPQLAFDRTLGSLVLHGGRSGYPLQDTWMIDSDPELRPAIEASFLVPSDLGSDTLVGLSVRARGGGRGYTTIVPGIGDARDGAKLELWDAWSGTWRELIANSASPSDGGDLIGVTTAIEQAPRALTRTGEIHVRVEPTAGIGTGNAPAEVVLDFIELDVHLDLRR